MTTISRALAFLDEQGRPVEAAWARYLVGEGPRDAVLDALAPYQNDDGGFGQGLEPDIKAPDSQPFAARLAMQILHAIAAAPDEPVVTRLAGWLTREQDDDGCWRFPPGVYEHEIAPWFAGWTFPSLNPALCLAGWTHRLGIGDERMQQRVRVLADQLSSVEQIERGEFYDLLPYAEYYPWVDHPRRDELLPALVRRINTVANGGGYDDAGHFFEHVGPPSGAIACGLPPPLIVAQLDRLAAEQEADDGWPTPYDPSWRPWGTASAVATLRAFGRG